MVEDLQDENSFSKEKESKSKKKRLSIPILILTLWVFFTAVTIVIIIPRVKDTLSQTHAVEILKDINTARYEHTSHPAKIVLVESDGKLIPLSTTIQSTGATEFHSVIEELLTNYSESKGTSAIKDKTHLNGLTVSENVAFVDLSSQFLLSKNIELAEKQILMTLQCVDPTISRIVILVDGIPLS